MAFTGAVGTAAGGGGGGGGRRHPPSSPPSSGLAQDAGARRALPGPDPSGAPGQARPAGRLSPSGAGTGKSFRPALQPSPAGVRQTLERVGERSGGSPPAGRREHSTLGREGPGPGKHPGREEGARTCISAAPARRWHSGHTVLGEAPRSQTARIQGSPPPGSPQGPEMPPSESQCCEGGPAWGCRPSRPENQGPSRPGCVERQWPGEGDHALPLAPTTPQSQESAAQPSHTQC